MMLIKNIVTNIKTFSHSNFFRILWSWVRGGVGGKLCSAVREKIFPWLNVFLKCFLKCFLLKMFSSKNVFFLFFFQKYFPFEKRSFHDKMFSVQGKYPLGPWKENGRHLSGATTQFKTVQCRNVESFRWRLEGTAFLFDEACTCICICISICVSICISICIC